MKTKNKKYKQSPNIKSVEYTHKVGNHRFNANIFEDEGGELVASIGKDNTVCRSDAKLEDWIEDATEMYDFYSNLIDFLDEVRYIRKKD